MCVCRECAQPGLPQCHLPFLDPCTIVHVHQHQCTSPPNCPPPQITKQKGLRLVSGLGLLPLPPLLLTPLHLPSWTIGPLSTRKKRNTDQLDNTFKEYRIAEKNSEQLLRSEKYNWLVACPKTGHSTSPMSQNLPDWKEITPLNISTCTLSARWLVNSPIECPCQQRVSFGLKTNSTFLDD